MRKKLGGILGFLGMSILLVILFLASSTDLIIKEKEAAVYEISVMIDSEDDSGWENFKLGIDNASRLYNVDISFITLYDDNSPIQQLELVQREISSGAQGLIISSEDLENMEAVLEIVPSSVPIIVIGSSVESSKVKTSYEASYEDMAVQLYSVIKEENPDKRITVLTQWEGKNNIDVFVETIKEICENDNNEIEHIKIESPDDMTVFLGGVIFQDDRVLIVPELNILTQVSTQISKYMNESHVEIPLYGLGWSGNIWHRIEDGSIDATVVTDGYEIGYLSIKEMYGYLTGQRFSEKDKYENNFYIINKENLYEKENQIMLFPIG